MGKGSLRNELVRAEIVDRVRALRSDADPRWGDMNAARAMTHLADAMRLAFPEGEVLTSDETARFASKRREWIHEWPWPEGRAESPPEGLITTPADWEADRTMLLELIARYADEPAEPLAGSHPLFGQMTSQDWDVLMFKHLDHHLRQFGV